MKKNARERYIVEIYPSKNPQEISVGVFPEGYDWDGYHSYYSDEPAETIKGFMRTSLPREIRKCLRDAEKRTGV